MSPCPTRTDALTGIARADQYFSLNYFSADGTLNVNAVLDVASTTTLCGYNGTNLGYNSFTNTAGNLSGFAILGITGTRSVSGVVENITRASIHPPTLAATTGLTTR
jgi:hypothetical protein